MFIAFLLGFLSDVAKVTGRLVVEVAVIVATVLFFAYLVTGCGAIENSRKPDPGYCTKVASRWLDWGQISCTQTSSVSCSCVGVNRTSEPVKTVLVCSPDCKTAAAD